MASGFVKGALAGVVVSGLVLGVVSELMPPSTALREAAPQPGAVEKPESEAAEKAPAAEAPETQPVAKPEAAPATPAETKPEAEAAPEATAPTSSAPEAAPAAPEPAPGAPAATEGSEPAPAAPQGTPTAPETAPAVPQPDQSGAAQAPAAPPPPATAPQAAQEAKLGAAPEAEPSVLSTPKPEAPVTESPAAKAPQAPAGAGSGPKFVQAPPNKVRLDSTAPAATELARQEPAPEAPGQGESAPSLPGQAPQVGAQPAPEAAPPAPGLPPVPQPRILRPGAADSAPGAAAQPLPQARIILKTAPAQSATPLPKIAPGLPRVSGAPQPGFGQTAPGVITGRLPTIGAAPQAAPTQAAPEAPAQSAPASAEAAPPLADDAALPAYRRYAAAFENPQQKPVLSIILIDTGGTLDRAKLAALPLNISFAIDPATSGAAAAAALYRAAGHEVLILARGIPADASAADLDRILAQDLQVVPQAVGVLDPAEGGFAANRALSQEIVARLAKHGLALLTYARGLDAANQIAQSSDLPAGQIYRRLDAHDENPFTVTRYLDRAAFKAAQDGRVVVVGHTRPDTIEGLKEWAGDSRARTLALAPVTATLTP